MIDWTGGGGGGGGGGGLKITKLCWLVYCLHAPVILYSI